MIVLFVAHTKLSPMILLGVAQLVIMVDARARSPVFDWLHGPTVDTSLILRAIMFRKAHLDIPGT